MIDITEIVTSFVSLILAVLTAFVVPWIKTKIENEKLCKIKEWTEIFVTAAEQIYKGTGRGAEKYEYVVKELAKKGLYLNAEKLDEIEALIESKVFDLKEDDKK